MTTLGKQLVVELLEELDRIDLTELKKSMTLVGVYAGRFQPFGRHHYQAYQQLKAITGKNTFVATSNVTDKFKSPFTFNEKKKIISKYGIPTSNIVRVKSPYAPEEVLKRFDPKTTALVVIYGEKDADRLQTRSKYYKPYVPNKPLEGYLDKGYYIIAKHEIVKVGGKEISGTTIRNMLGGHANEEQKKKWFKEIFGWYDEDIFDMVVTRLESIVKESITNPSVLLEGGAYGHMSHPFDDNQLTFGDMKNIVRLALQGELDKEAAVTEKLDGQALSISWKDGKLIAARNKSHLKNEGGAALDINGVKQMFSGRGAISDAFVSAMNDLERAVGKLSAKQRALVFDEGKNFMNLEVIFPKTQNVIPYDTSMLVFHGVTRYDVNGNPVEQKPTFARMLAGMIKQVNQNVQGTFTISSPTFLTVPPHQDFSRKQKYFVNKIELLKKRFGLKDSNTLAEYHQAWWDDFIYRQAKKLRYPIAPQLTLKLIRRWAFFDKSERKTDIMKSIKHEQFKSWVDSFDSENHTEQVKQNMLPFEKLFLELGAEVLKNASGFLAANPKQVVQKLRKDVEKTVSELQNSSDLSQLKKLELELDRINAIGGFESIVPIEGLVFMYKGKTYKLTGSFAPINQILGIVKYSR